eukprot:1477057-Alexandrium_andersonii.AAC.1
MSGASSGAATPTGLRRMLSEEFDPTKESRESWQARMLRVSLQLERSGQPLTAAETEKLVRKCKYCEVLQGQSPKEQ